MLPPIITLTTDFGADSPYVAQMKAVILGMEPAARIVDITHSIHPQQISEGAVALADSCCHFPRGSIHIAVVDPGVGTQRHVIAASIDGHFYIAPDNGLLSLVARRRSPDQIVRLTRREYWRPHVTRTFHGRDIMAPVAAHLAQHTPLEQLGDATRQWVRLDSIDPVREGSLLRGQCVIVDAFGNLLTNIVRSMLPDPMPALRVVVAGQTVAWVNTYGEKQPGTLVALFGSSDRLEVAEVQGSAAKRLGAGPGCEILVELL